MLKVGDKLTEKQLIESYPESLDKLYKLKDTYKVDSEGNKIYEVTIESETKYNNIKYKEGIITTNHTLYNLLLPIEGKRLAIYSIELSVQNPTLLLDNELNKCVISGFADNDTPANNGTFFSNEQFFRDSYKKEVRFSIPYIMSKISRIDIIIQQGTASYLYKIVYEYMDI